MPMKRRRGSALKFASSSKWSAEDAAEKLGVVYKGVHDTTESDGGDACMDYERLLHYPDTGAGIPRIARLGSDRRIDMIEKYRNLMLELLHFDDASSEILALLTRVVPRELQGPHMDPMKTATTMGNIHDDDDDGYPENDRVVCDDDVAMPTGVTPATASSGGSSATTSDMPTGHAGTTGNRTSYSTGSRPTLACCATTTTRPAAANVSDHRDCECDNSGSGKQPNASGGDLIPAADCGPGDDGHLDVDGDEGNSTVNITLTSSRAGGDMSHSSHWGTGPGIGQPDKVPDKPVHMTLTTSSDNDRFPNPMAITPEQARSKCSCSSDSEDTDSICSIDSADGNGDDDDDVNAFLESLAKSKQRIMEEKDMLDPHKKFYNWYYDGCHSMLRFVSRLMKLVQRASNDQQIDEDSFRQLFIYFALIFCMDLSLVNTRKPLVLQGREVETNPDLLYEKFPEVISNATKQIFSVTVAECKREAKPKKVRHHQTTKYPLRQKRPYNLIAQDSLKGDTTVFPSDLRGQHACQLVNELPYTFMPNKNCMLGFVVQGTKIRLTCLIMDREIYKRIRMPEFEASTEESKAEIYFTKAYDMLQKEGRHHLAYIMATLSSYAGDIRIH